MIFRFFVGVSILLLSSLPAFAGPDDYVCDTAIYGADAAQVKPNVLIIFDTSGSMDDDLKDIQCGAVDVAGPYNDTVNYTSLTATKYCGSNSGGSWSSTCSENAVYKCTSYSGGNCTNWSKVMNDFNSISCSSAIKNALSSTGYYTGNRNLENNCRRSSSQSYHYELGNYIVWANLANGGPVTGTVEECREVSLGKKVTVAKSVVTDIVNSTEGVNFGLMRFNSNDEGGNFASYAVGGSTYKTTIKDMVGIHNGRTTNQQALVATINSSAISASGYTPLAETLYEAMLYFKGASSHFNSGTTYASPITSTCQPNYVIVVTDGAPTNDQSYVPTAIGDYDRDGRDPGSYSMSGSDYLDDVARYLYVNDMSSLAGTQNVKVYTVGFDLSEDQNAAYDGARLLRETAENGGGKAFLANNYANLSSALTSIIAEALSIDTSFVAPVVSSSPEGGTDSGYNIYFGLFKPVSQRTWRGNLKKFGLDAAARVLDSSGSPVTDANGSFLPTASSYWSTADGIAVDKGGVGAVMASRNLSTNPRTVYTSTGGSLFSFSSVTAAQLGVGTTAERDRIVDYVYGFDSGDADLDGNTTENRDWLLGDILHSKPTVVVYSGSTKVLYAGSNDGQLHAFADSDGREIWSFVPGFALTHLASLVQTVQEEHAYFVDSTPRTLLYDRNGNGVVETGDKVFLLFGLRRGGGVETLAASGSRGAYYALDVTNPTSPQFLWELSGTTTGFAELGETWSEPRFGKVQLTAGGGGTVNHFVAFIGAGYDNNEDVRYGSSTGYDSVTDTTDITIQSNGGGAVSSGTAARVNSRGRGIYVIDLGVVSKENGWTPATSPTALWSWSSSSAGSFAGEVIPLDKTGDGLIDTLYAANTDGSLWRFDVGDTDKANWSAKKIFQTGSGRKFLSTPEVIVKSGSTAIFIGSGDRAHPLNTAVADRIYAINDRDQSAALADTDLTAIAGDVLATGAGNGWYISLPDPGEKVLNKPVYYEGYLNFNTYSPSGSDVVDPCSANLGNAYLYVLDAKTAAPTDLSWLNGERRASIGSGISSPPILFLAGNVPLLVGATQRNGQLTIYTLPTKGNPAPRQIYWRQK